MPPYQRLTMTKTSSQSASCRSSASFDPAPSSRTKHRILSAFCMGIYETSWKTSKILDKSMIETLHILFTLIISLPSGPGGPTKWNISFCTPPPSKISRNRLFFSPFQLALSLALTSEFIRITQYDTILHMSATTTAFQHDPHNF